MLKARNKHLWSSDGLTWSTPDFAGGSGDNGGSAADWPRDKGRDGDVRRELSFWGDDGSVTGGCCSTSTTEYRTYPALPANGISTAWGHACTYTNVHTCMRLSALMGCLPKFNAAHYTVGIHHPISVPRTALAFAPSMYADVRAAHTLDE